MARHGKKIDFVHWSGFVQSVGGLGAGTFAGLLNSATHEPETLLRIRGNVLAYLDATQAPGALIHVGIGICQVPEGTGSTVLWVPLTDGDAPWIWVERFALGYEEMVTDVVDVVSLPIFRGVIDNKAMRKLRNRELQVVVEQATLLGAASLNFNITGRALTGSG